MQNLGVRVQLFLISCNNLGISEFLKCAPIAVLTYIAVPPNEV